MSEKLCTLRTKGGGGGKYTETSLWTNQSPTSSFTSQTVTLSESMDNFKYLKIKYAFSTSLYADANCNEIVISVADFKKSLSAASGNALIVVGGSSSTTRYTRFVFYPSDTGVQFGHSVQFQTSTTNDNTCIPLEILGLNELAHGKSSQTLLWTNPSPTSAFAAQTVSLDLSEYDAIILQCSSLTTNTLPSVYPTNACSQQYLPIPYGTSGQSMYRISYGIGVEGSTSFNTNRETIVTTSGVTFSGGYRNYTANNSAAIPIAIYGVKNI